QRIAAHARSHRVGGFTTVAEHMPASHRAHLQWTPAKLIAWGERIGAATAGVVRWQMEHRPHPEQGYRACLGLMRLARQYGDERLEAACARAQSIRAPNYRHVRDILANGRDLVPRSEPAPEWVAPVHDNVRGAANYH
ncbi:MAG TPA: IS21 family transposase, partial [Rubrivivax sp.]|nr:IS21 family transposase [Rubrivivax sp.]